MRLFVVCRVERGIRRRMAMERSRWRCRTSPGGDLQFGRSLPKVEHELLLRAAAEDGDETRVARRLGHAGAVQEVCFAGHRDAVVSVDDLGDLSLWQVRRGRRKKQLEKQACQSKCHESKCVNCLVVREGTAYTGGDDRCLRVWDLERGIKDLQCFEGHDSYVLDCDVAREEGLVASSSIDRTVKLWTRSSPMAVGEFDAGDACWSVNFDLADPHVVYTAGRKGIKLWDIRRLKTALPIRRVELAFNGTKTSRIDGEGGASGECPCNGISKRSEPWLTYPSGPSIPIKRMYSPSHGHYTENFVGHTAIPFSAKPLPNGLHILTSAYDYTHKLWTCDGQGICTLNWASFWDAVHLSRPRPTPKPAKPAISSNGRLVISGTEDGRVVCWDLATVMQGPSCTENHIQVAQVLESAVTCVCISDDDTTIAVGSSTGELAVKG